MSNVYAVAIVNKEGEIESMYHPGAYVDPKVVMPLIQEKMSYILQKQ